jgi:anaerobic selenocysteine-containing dehydrogenase
VVYENAASTPLPVARRRSNRGNPRARAAKSFDASIDATMRSIMSPPLDGSDTGARRIVRAAGPHDCPDTCAMLVTVENGRAIEIKGAPDHPPTAGTLCTKVARYLDRTYSSERLRHPLRRVGAKGEGRFARIGWDEALDEIAARFRAIAASPDGPQAILPYSYCGTMGLLQGSSMDRRFFHRLGASLLDRTICAAAGKAGWASVVGASVGMDVERYVDSRLILIWGSNPVTSNLHFWTRAQEAKRRGARLVAIDPYRSVTAEKSHEHVALLPGTDAALALGIMHLLIANGHVDRDYVSRHTIGYDALAARAREWTPERVADTCGIPCDQVLRLAHDYGTIRPAAIRLNYGMQRVHGGGNAVRAVACLPALVGAWRDPAGGALLSSSGTYPVDSAALERPDLIRGTPRTINMSAIGDALTSASPPIRAIYVYNANPVAVAPDSSRVVAGFSRPDLFCVVHEIFRTDTADYADILLPATTQLEQTDIHSSYGHLYALANNPAIAPIAEALPNTEVFRRLAARMGFAEPCFRDSDDDLARQAYRAADVRAQGIDWQRLKRDGWHRLNVPEIYAPFANGGFPTASGKCEFRSEALAAQGLDPLPAYVPPRESAASNPALAARYPLAFISPPARHFLNSSFSHLPAFLADEKTPHLDIHPDDAASRGIRAGDPVRIFNDRGSLLATARVTDRARTGVVVAPSIWWRRLAPGGENANAVTSQALTDLGRAATFYDCLVEVQPA